MNRSSVPGLIVRSAKPDQGLRQHSAGKLHLSGWKVPLLQTAHLDAVSLVEGVTALASFFLFVKFGPSLQYLFLFAFLCSLIVITVIDLYHQIIPDVISLPELPSDFWEHSCCRRDRSCRRSLDASRRREPLRCGHDLSVGFEARRDGRRRCETSGHDRAFLGWKA